MTTKAGGITSASIDACASLMRDLAKYFTTFVAETFQVAPGRSIMATGMRRMISCQ